MPATGHEPGDRTRGPKVSRAQNTLDIYKLLEDLATIPEIQSLLRPLKEEHPSEVQIGGSKAELIESLQKAVNATLLDRKHLYELLQDCEENGAQYIRYWMPTTDTARNLCSNPKLLADKLLGTNWQTRHKFPRLTDPSGSHEVVDFRIGVNGKSRDWVLKLYGSRIVTKRLDRDADRETAIGRYKVEFENRSVRTVCLARWNDHPTHGILEVRYSQSAVIEHRDADETAVWDAISPVLPRSHFESWSLSGALLSLIKNAHKHATLYTLSSVKFRDNSEGVNTIQSDTGEESISSDPGRLKAAEALMEEGGTPGAMAILWRADGSDGVLTRNIRSVVGRRYSNEQHVAAHIRGTELDYITDQFRAFAGAGVKDSEDDNEHDRPLRIIDLSRAKAKHPELKSAWEALEAWFARNKAHFIYEDRLARNIRNVSPLLLGRALGLLVEQGDLSLAYRLRLPNGPLLGDYEYNTLEEIPDEIEDFDEDTTRRTDSLELVTGYRVGG